MGEEIDDDFFEIIESGIYINGFVKTQHTIKDFCLKSCWFHNKCRYT